MHSMSPKPRQSMALPTSRHRPSSSFNEPMLPYLEPVIQDTSVIRMIRSFESDNGCFPRLRVKFKPNQYSTDVSMFLCRLLVQSIDQKPHFTIIAVMMPDRSSIVGSSLNHKQRTNAGVGRQQFAFLVVLESLRVAASRELSDSRRELK